MVNLKENYNKVKQLFNLHDYVTELIDGANPDIDEIYENTDLENFESFVEFVYMDAVNHVLCLIYDGEIDLDELV